MTNMTKGFSGTMDMDILDILRHNILLDSTLHLLGHTLPNRVTHHRGTHNKDILLRGILLPDTLPPVIPDHQLITQGIAVVA